MAGIVPLGRFEPGSSHVVYEGEYVGETQMVRVHRRREPDAPACEMCGRDIVLGDIYLRVWGTETGTGHWHAACAATGEMLAARYAQGSYSPDMIQEAESEGEITWDDEARAWRDTSGRDG